MRVEFSGRDLISMRELSRQEIEHILNAAERTEFSGDMLKGRLMSTLFFEPSTRTRLSFETAMKRLGGEVVGFSKPGAASLSKGENLTDTIKTVSCYSDVIVLRHPREGAARLAAEVSDVPVINAGDGSNQHPTQALTDLYTIRREHGRLNVSVAMVGDLKYARTVRSLGHGLAKFGARLLLTSPPGLEMSEELCAELEGMGAKVEVCSSIEEAVENADVLYVTRIQKERFPDPEEYRKVQGAYRITPELLEIAKPGMVVLHPLPRVDEISPEVDHTERARYFHQVRNSIPIRMAVLTLLLGVV